MYGTKMAIVAGGAPRDWYFNKEASDIDVFFYGITSASVTKKRLKAVGIDVLEIKSGDNIPEHYKRNPELFAVYNASIDGVPVQLMQMKSPTFDSVVPKFPLSICKVWYKNGHIIFEKHFTNSVKHRVIYITNDLYNNADGFIAKIKGKFPEFKFFNHYHEALEHILENSHA